MSKNLSTVENSISFSVKSDSLKTDSTKIKKKDKGGIIFELEAVECGTMDKEVWILEKYVPANGKRLGICQDDYSVSWLNTLRNYYGFSELIIKFGSDANTASGRITNAISSTVGYSKANDIILDLPGSNYYVTSSQEFSGLKMYYQDEPLESHGFLEPPLFNLNGLIDASIYIHTYNPGSPYVVGSSSGKYSINSTTSDYLAFLSLTGNTYINFTAYYGGLFSNVCDQSENWSFQQTYYGSQHVMNQWIHIDLDYDCGGGQEYGTLLSSANSQGLNRVWLYASGSGNMNRLNYFAEWAWARGWLNKIERKYIYTYSCNKPNPCDCNPNDVFDGWVLENEYQTQQTRTVSYP